MDIYKQTSGLIAEKRMSTQSSRVGHQEMKELAPGFEHEHASLTARRGECQKSLTPEKGKVIEGDISGDKNRILPLMKTKYNSNAFVNNGSGDKRIVENANKIYKTIEKKRDTTKDRVISGSGSVLVSEEATDWALTSSCDMLASKSTHDPRTLCKFIWHKWFAFCIYNMCLFTYHAAYLILNGRKKYVTALSNAFVGWTGARMITDVFETNDRITKSFAANFTAMNHTTNHVLSFVYHLLAPHMMPAKFQRRRTIKRRSTTNMLAVVLIVSITIFAGSKAQQVSLQF
jgi:hypothetical protein